MTDNDNLTAFIYAAMADYTVGTEDKRKEGDTLMTCARPYYAEAMVACTETDTAFIIAQ